MESQLSLHGMNIYFFRLLFGRYIEAIEEFLEFRYQREFEQYKDWVENTIGEELWEQVLTSTGETLAQAYHRSHSDSLDSYFPNILRNSCFVSLFSFVEARLIEICRSFRREDIRIGLSDLRGQNGIDRAKIYLEKILQFNFPSRSVEWSDIQNYRRFRNCIVHNESNLNERLHPRDKESLRHYVDHNANLSLSGEKIIIHKGFCEEAVETVARFFELLFDSIATTLGEEREEDSNQTDLPDWDSYMAARAGMRRKTIYLPTRSERDS